MLCEEQEGFPTALVQHLIRTEEAGYDKDLWNTNCIFSKSGIQLRLRCAEIMRKQGHEEPVG